MHNPPVFRVDEPGQLHALLDAHPLATLVVQTADGLEASHVPLLLHEVDGRRLLRGHVARANPLWRLAGDGCPALAVFNGPQAYITPSWYPSKRKHGRVVPTWDYAVVHAHGTLTAIDDPDWLHDQVEALTSHHELHRPAPWKVDDAPEAYLSKMLRAVVGIELAVTRFEGKWKMSQNRDATDVEGVIAGLRATGDAGDSAVAELVSEVHCNARDAESS